MDMRSLVHLLAIPDAPMTAKLDTKPSNVHITTEVAKYGLRKALRPFLKRPGLHFTAAVVVPDADELTTYHEAMKRIFAAEPRNEDWDEEVTVVRSFKDLNDANTLSSIYAMRPAPGDYPDGEQGDVLVVEFTVAGVACIGLNGGPTFKHNESFSFQISTEDQ